MAARSTGEVLREVVEGPPVGRAADLAGPEEADLVEMARSCADRYMSGRSVVPETQSMADLPPLGLLPADGFRV